MRFCWLAPVAPLLLAGTLLGACTEHQGSAAAQRIDALQASSSAPASHEWRHYLGDPASSQHSPLQQITTDNVGQLSVAWTYDPGDAGDYDTLIPTNPLIVKGILYGLSASKNLFALNAATGEELWVHRFNQPRLGKGAGRGLVYWSGELDASGSTAEWILVGLGDELFAVDARTGELAAEFGSGGRIDLREGLDRPAEDIQLSVIAPGALFENLLIMGFGTSEFYGAAPGHIRAFQLPEGKIRWTFRTIPEKGEFGADTWPDNSDHIGGANSWAGITVDTERAVAFVPTGSAAYDYYGADRAGDNLFANSLIALDARSGKRLWHYQFVRHDLWDRDLSAPPNLVTVTVGEQQVPAVAQATKSGHLFLFHRETGAPLYPHTEVAVTGPGVPGEHLPPSQPLPLKPPPFAQQRFQVTDLSPESTEYVTTLIDGMTRNEPFRAPDEQGLVIYPGLDGGAQWGGQAYDAEQSMLYINTNEVPWHFRMVPQSGEPQDILSLEFSYLTFCGGCHGADRAGSGGIFPSLRDIGDRYWPWEVWSIMRNGLGRMPAMREQPWYYLLGPLIYLYTAGDDAPTARPATAITGYIADGFHELLDEHDLPGSRPPWGSLVAMDVNAGEIVWKVPLGDYPQALAMGRRGLGAANYGGAVVTAGGLLFIAATPDSILRAFDRDSGAVLWEAPLPAAGFATPAVYAAQGRQFVVVAAGGGKLKQPSGSAYVAFALPQNSAQRKGTSP